MIIISPSKTMQFDDVVSSSIEPDNNYLKLLNRYKKLSKKKMHEMYQVSDKILDQVYKQWKEFESLKSNIALKAYTGLSFQGIQYDSYSKEEQEWLEKHLRILSAFYGQLTPHTMIKPYRLDFTSDKSLYNYWNISIDEPIINLASNEFSKMIHQPMITITFMENENGVLKNKATYAKQARGYFVHYLIKNQSESIETLQAFDGLGYAFSEEFSTDQEFIYVKIKR